MLKNFRDRIALSGVTVLIVGIALLIFTFVSAFGFLGENLAIFATSDLTQTFGAALAPLIATCIRIMYLGVMGWVGSIITIRGVTIVAHAPSPQVTSVAGTSAAPQTASIASTNGQKEQKLAPEKVKPKTAEEPKKPQPEAQPEVKTPPPAEPQFLMIPPEPVTAPPPTPQTQQIASDQPKKTEEKSGSS